MPYLDLEYECRTNGEFAWKIREFGKRLNQLDTQSQRHSSYIQQFNETLHDFLVFCNFNMVFLTPYYFPRYPKNKPLNYADYPFSFQLFEFQIAGFTVIKGSRQISKSTSFGARQLMNARVYPGFRSLYICPRNDQLSTYANKLREMERACRGLDSTPGGKFRKNLNLKEFTNGSIIELIYVLSSASNARGKSTDELIYDEAQEFDPDLEIEIDMIQKASERPVTLYAGTSLTTESFLEHKFRASSMCHWVTKCTGCNKDNIPLPEHHVLDMIQPDGPCCYKCGKPLDIRSGLFVPSNKHLHESGRRGYHVPQIIVPAVYNHQIRWFDIYEKKIKYGGNRKFLQEILGVATEEGEREITKQNLIDICSLPQPKVLHTNAIKGRYEYVVSGCDWGGSDYIPAEHIKLSTTVHAMMGVRPDGGMELIHFQRYYGMQYDQIIGSIIRDHQALKGFAIATDFGVGTLYNSKIREVLPLERHLVFGYVGPEQPFIAPPTKGHGMYNQWSLNKSESISFLYEAIRGKRIRCFPWQLAEEYLSDFLNVYRAPAEKAGSGATTFVYRSSPSRPSDSLHAVNYAYTLGRIMLGEPLFADRSIQLRLRQTLTTQAGLSGQRNGPRAFSG